MTTLTAAEDTRRRTLYAQGWNDCQIAADRGVTSQAIRAWRAERGLEPNRGRGGNGGKNGKVLRLATALADDTAQLLDLLDVIENGGRVNGDRFNEARTAVRDSLGKFRGRSE